VSDHPTLAAASEWTYEPFTLGGRFRVAPRGALGASDGRLDLVVARGAFGSGEHETTASCVEVLEGLADVRGARVLDLGAGTGILGIAALALGAAHAVLVDNDPQAVLVARRHVALNGMSDRATVVLGEIGDAPGPPFDIVLANLHGDVLVALGPALVARVRPGGVLVLSGILWEHNWDVRDAYGRLGCTLGENRFLSEYSSLLMRLPVSHAETCGPTDPPSLRLDTDGAPLITTEARAGDPA